MRNPPQDNCTPNRRRSFSIVRRRGFYCLGIAIFWVGLGAMLAPASSAQTWVPTGSMSVARSGFTATLLPSGKVLIAGGQDSSGNYLVSAELYDPTTGTFTATGSMTTARSSHTATLLSNSQVLIAGGANGSSTNGAALSSAELYDPTSGTFTPTGSMNTGRWGHTATLLSGGKVLIAGGFPGPGCCGVSFLSSAEIYDPTAGTFSYTGNMNSQRGSPSATLLSNSKVLVAGGTQYTFQGYDLSSAELYDPSTGSFTLTGSMTTARSNHTSTLLKNGKVLIAGGVLIGQPVFFSSAELYDPVTGTFSATGSMTTARMAQTATLLNNGLVLVAGGINSTGILASAELYDPNTGIFSPTANMITARVSQGGVLLSNGQVLVVGGVNGAGPLASAELFEPVPAPPTTTVSSSADPSVFGQSVTLTATVTPSSGTGTPTGTVTFTDTSTSTTLGIQTLSAGQAALTISSLSVGAHAIAAAYSGDSNFQASTGTLSQTVNPAATTTVDSSSANPSILGSTVTFTATVNVAAPGAGTPTGSIAFKDGATTLATVPINSGGQATVSTNSLSVSSHLVIAVYSGDSNFNGSASSTLTQLVQYEPAGTACGGDFGHQILQPVNADGTSVFKQGRTVPAKFRVCDANGISIGTSGIVSSFFLTQIITGTVSTTVEDVVDTNNPDTAFRWDPTSQQWIFNISTQNLSAGSTYIFTIALNDGTTIPFQFGMR